jgi:phenylacetate-CoA ligase
MTEAMRDYLERRLVKVRSGYGASDIQVGIAGETDLSVRVRRLLVERADVREALLGAGETRVPMVFQYNPLENYIEIHDAGDAVVTLNNSSVLSPKLRYNVGDEGLTLSRARVLQRLTELGALDPSQPLPRSWAAPFFFLFGRRDGTVSYMGANIYPIDVEYGLYRDENLAASIESFCIELQESPALDARPVVHVQLRRDARVERAAATERLRAGLVDHLASASRDFAEALREDPSVAEIGIVLHEHASGPFAGMGAKIKNVYVIGSS